MKKFVDTMMRAGFSEQYANAAWFTLNPRPTNDRTAAKAAREYIRKFNVKEGKLPITIRK